MSSPRHFPLIPAEGGTIRMLSQHPRAPQVPSAPLGAHPALPREGEELCLHPRQLQQGWSQLCTLT